MEFANFLNKKRNDNRKQIGISSFLGYVLSSIMHLWSFLNFRWILFIAVVVTPMLFVTIYYAFFASDIYTSQALLVIRQLDKKNTSSLGSLLKAVGVVDSKDNMFTVQQYLMSRDTMMTLDRNLHLRKMYSSRSIDIFKRFNPLGFSGSYEEFYKYFTDNIISVNVNATTSICEINVNAYSKEAAYDIVEGLIFLGEGFVNEINSRSQQDLIDFYRTELNKAKQDVSDAAIAMFSYRNANTVFDPTRESSIQLTQIAKLQDELIAVRGQLSQYRSVASESPFIVSLGKRRAELEKEIKQEMSKVTGDKNSMIKKSIEFERLTLEQSFAEKQWLAAMAALQQAKSDAQHQMVYLEKISGPSQPDKAMHPERIKDVILISIGCLMLYGIILFLASGIEEHRL